MGRRARTLEESAPLDTAQPACSSHSLFPRLALDGSIDRYRKASAFQRLERKWFPLPNRHGSGKTRAVAKSVLCDLEDAAAAITLTCCLESQFLRQNKKHGLPPFRSIAGKGGEKDPLPCGPPSLHVVAGVSKCHALAVSDGQEPTQALVAQVSKATAKFG